MGKDLFGYRSSGMRHDYGSGNLSEHDLVAWGTKRISMANLDVYAGIVGRTKRHHCLMFHLSSRHDDIELIYPFWILRDGARVTLIDTGFVQSVALARNVGEYRDPIDILAALGVAPGDVDRIVLSHLHYDHFGAPDRFPNARFIVQRDDMTFFSGVGRLQPAGALADASSVAALEALHGAGRVELLDGNKILGAGLSVVRVGGHTPGSQVIVLEGRTGPIVFACDCSHMYDNLKTRTPSAMIYRYDEYQRGFDAIELLASGGRWFPGHDPTMLDELTSLGQGLYGLTT